LERQPRYSQTAYYLGVLQKYVVRMALPSPTAVSARVPFLAIPSAGIRVARLFLINHRRAACS